MTVDEVLHILIDAASVAEDVRARLHEAVHGATAPAPDATAPEGA